jgi:signal transduction histidine kinase
MCHNEIFLENSFNNDYLENFFDAYLIMDTKGIIIYFSNSTLNLFQKTSEQIKDKHISVLFPDENGSMKESYKNMEYELNFGNQKVSIFRTRTVFKDNQGNLTHVIEGILDITNCKRMHELTAKIEIEKARSEQDRSDFINWKEMYASKDMRVLDSIIYALNSSLNSFGGPLLLDFVKENMKKDKNGYHLNKDAYEAFEELMKSLYPLLNNIAKLEKLLKIKTELTDVNLDEFIQFVKKYADDFASNYKSQNNKIQITHVPSNYGKINIRISKNYLEEIFSELLTNAFKYSKPDENIWIEIELCPNILKCRVTNIPVEYKIHDQKFTGVPYEYTEKVFNPFERLNWNIQNKIPEKWSFGLGLFAVRKMVEKMNGKIECYNGLYHMLHQKAKPVTTFCISLPFSDSRGNL